MALTEPVLVARPILKILKIGRIPFYQDSRFADKLHLFFADPTAKTFVYSQSLDGKAWIGQLDACHPYRSK